ncbi:unnamed protein product [Adineta steineri]|uniref:Uncharacterized protein n=1 Tax=Adineta steineri TaxID=433720 RepID=A0A815ZGH8_9BILA|nr:unnamed protein product [Adineta steineri]CAF1582954.1 unnamed protein product [Adineta steineri]
MTTRHKVTLEEYRQLAYDNKDSNDLSQGRLAEKYNISLHCIILNVHYSKAIDGEIKPRELSVIDPVGAIVISLYIIICWIPQIRLHIRNLTGYTARSQFLQQLTRTPLHHSSLVEINILPPNDLHRAKAKGSYFKFIIRSDMNVKISAEKNDANTFAMDTVDQEKQSHEIEPTTEELNTLEHIPDHIPLAAWMIVVCKFCESFTFYGMSGPFQNYIQFPVPGSNDTQPGALNRGHQTATLLTTFFGFFCSIIPIVGAIVADQFWGKYKAIFISCIIYSVGLSVLVVSSIPVSINAGTALPGLIIAMIIIGIGSGGVQSNFIPLMGEQYTRKTLIVKGKMILSKKKQGIQTSVFLEIKGKKKIIDPQITIQSLFNWSYWVVSLASLSPLLTTYVEKYHSFWLAYLIPLIVFMGAIIVLVFGYQRYIRAPPNGSLLIQAFRVIKIAFRLRRKLGKQDHIKHMLDYAKQVETSDETTETNEKMNVFIDDLKQAIHACRVFAFYPIYWICYNQMYNNLTSQAAQMNVGPLPNDILQNIDPFVLIIFIPIFEKIIYPLLRRLNINFKPILRITCGFIVVSLAMAWTAIVQHLIYSTGPNYSFTPQPCSTCQKYNNITVAWQIPSYFLIAISEIFANITGLEYAFTQAPTSMKSIVMSLYVFTSAIGSALSFALIPVTVDPKLLWMYTSLSIVAFVIGIIFYVTFRNDDKDRNCVLPEETSTNPPKQGDI